MVVRMLIEKGVDVNALDNRNESALMAAILNGIKIKIKNNFHYIPFENEVTIETISIQSTHTHT